MPCWSGIKSIFEKVILADFVFEQNCHPKSGRSCSSFGGGGLLSTGKRATLSGLFPVILTDNGSEFSNPPALEFSPFNGRQRSRIFYFAGKSLNNMTSTPLLETIYRKEIVKKIGVSVIPPKNIVQSYAQCAFTLTNVYFP